MPTAKRTPTSTTPGSRTPLAILVAAGLAMLSPTAHAQSTFEWASPVDGDFSVAANWFPSVVPGELDTAVLGGVGRYVVTLDVSVPLAELQLTNPEASLQLQGRSLTVRGLEGPGEVVVRGTPGAGHSTYLFANGGATLNGRIGLAGAGYSGAIVEAEDGTVAVVGPEGILTGQGGGLAGDWISYGTIAADRSGWLAARGIEVRGGTLRASNGGTLALDETSISNATIEGGTGGTFATNVNTVVTDSVIRGQVTIEPREDLTFGTGVDIQGILVLHDVPSDSSGARLFVKDDVVIDGVVRLAGSSPRKAVIKPYGTSTGHALGPNAIISGTNGQIIGQWTSEADIFIDQPGEIEVRGMTATAGTLRSSNGGVLTIDGCKLTNVTLVAGPNSQFGTSWSTVLTDTRLVGTYPMRPGNALTLGPGVVIEEELVMHDEPGSISATLLYINPGVTVEGVIRMEGDTTGMARLEPMDGTGQTLGESGTITGSMGRLIGSLSIRGTLSPSPRPGRLGLFELFNANLTLEPTARVEIDITSPTPTLHDRIEGTGSVTLGGTLAVDFAGSYIPQGGHRFAILTADAIDGAFDTIDIETVGDPGPAHVVYTGDSVIVVVCAADRDGDGELTIFDFLEFQNQFDAGDLLADLDQDGQLTIFDFLVFQNRFDAGCG